MSTDLLALPSRDDSGAVHVVIGCPRGSRVIREDTAHEVRKATKRLRALLRLVRDHLGSRCYDRENRTFREARAGISRGRGEAGA